MPKTKVAAIIVTFNRSEDLRKSVSALNRQSHKLDYIVVVNNASTDNTKQCLEQLQEDIGSRLVVYHLEANTGGAGGYNKGLAEALSFDADRFWLLDDDAEVAANALEKLMDSAESNTDTYCTTSISSLDKSSLCWPPRRDLACYEQLSEITETHFAPFLGYFIHRETVEKIGLPDSDYFISGDDYEYSLRIKALGLAIYWVKASILYHPPQALKQFSIAGKTFKHLQLPAWRRYYDIRNRLWTQRSHGNLFSIVATLLSINYHWLITLIFEQDRIAQSQAYCRAIKDGLLIKRPVKNNAV